MTDWEYGFFSGIWWQMIFEKSSHMPKIGQKTWKRVLIAIFFQFLEHTVHFANRWEHYRARVKLNSVVEKKHVQLRLLSIHLDEKQVTAKLKSIVKLGNTKYNNGST